jgi:hypothetical protein
MAFGEKLYHVWSQSRLPSSMSICLLAEATKKEHTKAESDLEMSKRGGWEPDEILFIKRGFATISYWGGWN